MSAMLDAEFLGMLRCPETGQSLKLADAEAVRALNERIAKGAVHNRAGGKVEETCDGGLLRQDGKVVYPIRQGIPVMLISESIPL